jgi:hypothetical protein
MADLHQALQFRIERLGFQCEQLIVHAAQYGDEPGRALGADIPHRAPGDPQAAPPTASSAVIVHSACLSAVAPYTHPGISGLVRQIPSKLTIMGLIKIPDGLHSDQFFQPWNAFVFPFPPQIFPYIVNSQLFIVPKSLEMLEYLFYFNRMFRILIKE